MGRGMCVITRDLYAHLVGDRAHQVVSGVAEILRLSTSRRSQRQRLSCERPSRQRARGYGVASFLAVSALTAASWILVMRAAF